MLKKHSLLVTYLLMIGLVLIGLVYGFGLKHLPEVAFYLTIFLVSYFAIDKSFKAKFLSTFDLKLVTPENKNKVDILLLVFIVGFVIYHLIFLGHVPFISAVKILDYYQIAFIRQSIIEHDSSAVKYLSAFMIKGFIPFAILYFFITNKKLLYILLPIAIFYAISMMQKSLIVSIMIPLIIYTVISRSYLKAALYSLIAILGVFILVYATNPNLRATQEEIRAEMSKNGHLYLMEDDISLSAGFLSASDAIYTRVFVTTGLVAGYWFNKIPSEYPYAKGCGYHFVAPLLGCDFNDYDYNHILYNATYIKESKIGLKGTVTAANFVYDYANFGYFGLIYSGIILAFFFILIHRIFNNDFKWTISLNALFIFWLSSAAFHTLLLSGGWVLMILLYFTFKNVLHLQDQK